MVKEEFIISLKMAAGVFVAILLTQALNINFYESAGTIVIVSMLSAKKQSFKLAGIRLLAAIVSFTLASVLFLSFGFYLWVFTIYVFIFTFLMYRFDMKIAIVLNVVLVMHIYSLREITFPILLNEFLLMFLGILVALVFNYFVLDIEKELIGYQKQVESAFSTIFKNMGLCLINECNIKDLKAQLKKVNQILSIAKNRSYKYLNSYYLQNNDYYVEYFVMRKQQYYIIKSMQEFLKIKFLNQREVQLLKSFTYSFLEDNTIIDCSTRVNRLEEIKNHFNEAPLPTSHKQLKNRIALNRYLYSLEELIDIKIRFLEKFPQGDGD